MRYGNKKLWLQVVVEYLNHEEFAKAEKQNGRIEVKIQK